MIVAQSANKASQMREYLKIKTHDTMKAFWEDHNVKDLEGYLNISKVPQSFLLMTDSCEF
jgi:hypothetical protein